MRFPFALVTMSLFVTTAASANGRFPAANQLVFSSTRPSSLLVRTTFGALRSGDSGATWDWICETVAGYDGTQDPAILVFGDDSLSFASQQGLATSHDGGCSFPFAGDPLRGEQIVDLARVPGAPLRAVALASTAQSQASARVRLWQTSDGGRSWQPQGVVLPEGWFASNVDVATDRPEVLYVSGFRTQGAASQGVVAATSDGGATWVRHDVPTNADETGAYLAAIDPADSRRLYVRTDGPDRNRLLVSKDGGATFQDVLSADGDLLGFALSPDGARIVVGGTKAGVKGATRDDLVFRSVSTTPVTCLAWSTQGLFACGYDFASGFVVGRSDDGGAHWTALLPKLSNLRGPLTTCAPESPYAQSCQTQWPALAQELAISLAPSPSNGGVTTRSPTKDGGCQCTALGGRRRNHAVGYPLGLLGAVLLGRGRRRGTGRT